MKIPKAKTNNIPAGCFDPNCDFQITVDLIDEVNEGNEFNNTQFGSYSGLI